MRITNTKSGHILTLAFILVMSTTGCAQHNTSTGYELVAIKNNRKKVYSFNTRVRVRFQDQNNIRTIKGYIVSADSNLIYVVSNRANPPIFILTGNLQSVKRIRPVKRLLSAAFAVTLLGGAVETMPLIGGKRTDTEDATFAICAFAAPLFAISIPISLLTEKINEASIKKGWRFRTTKP